MKPGSARPAANENTDAAWLFEWTDPSVPSEWHGAVNGEGGTLVWTHG